MLKGRGDFEIAVRHDDGEESWAGGNEGCRWR